MSAVPAATVWLTRLAMTLVLREVEGLAPTYPSISFSLGWGVSVTFLRYGAQFFKQRRILQQYFAKAEVPRFCPIHTDEAHKMLKNLLDRPGDFDWLVRRYVSAALPVRNLRSPCARPGRWGAGSVQP